MSDSQLQEEVLLMPKELYEAALTDDFEFIENTVIDEYLLRKTCMSNNIMHIAIRHESMLFVRKALLRVPQLMWSPNVDGNTPFHVAAEMGNQELVVQICEEITDLSLLRMKNSTGNTPLHVALIHTKLKVARTLVQKDPGLASIINVSAEAPLHLAIKYFPHGDDDTDDWSNWKIRRCMRSLEEKRKNWDEGYYVIEEENMVVLIVLLLEIASYVTCWRDESGLTPLHRAASLNKSINVAIIAFMIECWPQCIEVCDNSGKTILHHLINRIVNIKDGKDFLTKTHIHSLKNHQDNDGNTPSHLAVMYSDFIIVELLCEENFNANWLLKNKKGLSVDIYINQSDMKKIMEGKAPMLMGEETCCTVECEDMFTLREHQKKMGEHFFKSHDSKGSSVVHKLLLRIKQGCIILPEEFLNFLEEVLDNCPELLEQPDNKGDTPMHVLAQLNPSNIMIHLANEVRNNSNTHSTLIDDIYSGPHPGDPKYFEPPYSNYNYVWERLENTSFFIKLIDLCLYNFEQEWLTLNEKGNTALHEAILAKNYLVFTKLADQCEEAATLVNKRNETVLHLLATLKSTPPDIVDKALENIINNNQNVDYHFLDDNGLTPVMRAIQVGNFQFAERLCLLCPKQVELRDPDGRTFWHQLIKLPTMTFESMDNFFTKEVVWRQLETKDIEEENTALHLAIDCNNFKAAQFFLKIAHQEQNFSKHLLQIRNKKGDSPGDMIGSLPYLSGEFEKFIWKNSSMIGIRSMWGIPTTQMQGYVNTMGVIAALLTTITFTAAFTVPGGLDQVKGTPLLIQEPAFQVFIVSDVFAMCFSMMVLFCLLWIMATGDKSKSVVLLDFSIILFLASLGTTLLTFMTGLYATMHLVKRWIAIVSLIPCCMLVLLMHRYIVIKLIIPSGKLILVLVDRAYHSAKQGFLNVNDLIKNGIPLVTSVLRGAVPRRHNMHQLPLRSPSEFPN